MVPPDTCSILYYYYYYYYYYYFYVVWLLLFVIPPDHLDAHGVEALALVAVHLGPVVRRQGLYLTSEVHK